MTIGDYDLLPLETGRFALDGGAMFGVVPKSLWQKSNPADEFNRIELALRSLLLKSKDRLILIDTGIGNKNSDKFRDIYKIDFSTYSLQSGLNRNQISAGDITDVIISHLHFDHAGGITSHTADGLSLTFPSAIHHIQEEQWDWAKNPTQKDRASFLEDDFLLLENSGKLNKLSGPGELFPGIELMVMYGHTQGMQIVKISDESNTLLYCADLIPTTSHIAVPWVMAYDNNPLITMNEKNRLLPQISNEKWVLFFEHDPYRQAATVLRTERGYAIGEEISLQV